MKTKILLVHNFYQQPGGEDQVFAGESALLEVNGHEVVRFTVHNDAIKEMGGLGAAAARSGAARSTANCVSRSDVIGRRSFTSITLFR